MKVFVVGQSPSYKSMFESTEGYDCCEKLEEADLLVFTGGSDVNPSLYGHTLHPSSMVNDSVDAQEESYWLEAKDRNIGCVGICRGAQLLNILNGGTLYQDVDNHAVPYGHALVDVKTGKSIHVSSTHHQMMRPCYGFGEVVAVANESTRREIHFMDIILDDMLNSHATGKTHPDVEVVWYEFNGDLCFQPHPEYPGFPATTRYFFELINRFYVGG